jgi:hypothetical protein
VRSANKRSAPTRQIARRAAKRESEVEMQLLKKLVSYGYLLLMLWAGIGLLDLGAMMWSAERHALGGLAVIMVGIGCLFLSWREWRGIRARKAEGARL